MINPKISLIVPCYNVEKYLSKCLDKLFSNVSNDLNCQIIKIEEALEYNSPMIQSVSKPAKRKAFFKMLDKTEFDELVEKNIKPTVWNRIREYLSILKNKFFV